MFGQYNILIVDDSKFVRLAVRSCLLEDQSDPIVITEAKHGKHALEILSNQNFDLILTDLEMPEMNGLELISQLRQDTKYDEIPIIFLTSVEDASKKVAAFLRFQRVWKRTSVMAFVSALRTAFLHTFFRGRAADPDLLMPWPSAPLKGPLSSIKAPAGP